MARQSGNYRCEALGQRIVTIKRNRLRNTSQPTNGYAREIWLPLTRMATCKLLTARRHSSAAVESLFQVSLWRLYCCRHPSVQEAAVVGIPDEKWGERPFAVVVLTPAGAVSNRTHEDISDKLRQHLASEFPKFWIPDRFIFVDEIPKTSVGKFDKETLRKRLLSVETRERFL